ncbi:MAG: hypothetical protein IPK80_20890 [Nannocystis sp.]|nr:hypothetical protein [Nannocystis sp.]
MDTPVVVREAEARGEIEVAGLSGAQPLGAGGVAEGVIELVAVNPEAGES